MNEKLISIGEAARLLNLSVDTLRRWDKSGKLPSLKKSGSAHRYYRESDLRIFLTDLVELAQSWLEKGGEPDSQFYCQNSGIFQGRNGSLETLLAQEKALNEVFPLIVAIAGEVGNNSFDHNLGQWPDVPGVFFGYNIQKRILVLADRGQGVLATLKRVRPSLQNDADALRVAFTEIISGRAPEARGNGLKFVSSIIEKNAMSLVFLSGSAELRQNSHSAELDISTVDKKISGCLFILSF
ncbi:MAG: hypothetical protein COU06_02900 [Candidatus Harrisonbacteria bacterium CG10_big_fil_rev_8_21_14_0_10_38_8]|uniref:HTH merR-type domain-containing protein n=1 Tax=Candidatus Harrisonbacteria bacterium CG10_big_fil_rev_8_21_14_0_10_38_8 TaxID=1974582 RepID=A0A2M6WJE7_9BACT|nr:MAG: hypothetical protein COU06_02900 [Candidatus Harrisonbacteria bacterium CG10_big_fil_rev_8_21_14_0_10_38_8]